MSSAIDKAVEALTAKLGGQDIGSVVKFVIEDEGAVMVEDGAVRAGDEEADVTVTATSELFQELLAGEVDPTMAYMSGKLKIEGDISAAMKLASYLV